MSILRLWLFFVLLIWQNSAFADSLISCSSDNCSSYKSSEAAAKISACEMELATTDCRSLGSDLQLKNCKTEAFCSNHLEDSYIAGCLFGVKDFAMDILKSPIELAKLMKKQLDYDSKYRNHHLYRACKDAEEKVNSGRLSNNQLDCKQTFWSSACPRTLLNNCKNSLLSEFPDIKKFYGSKYSAISYDQVYDDVHNRLSAIKAAKPSLAKFLNEHKEHPFRDIANIVKERLTKESICLSPKSFSQISCNRILTIVTLLAGGYGAVGKIGKVSTISSEASASLNLSGRLERMGYKKTFNGNPTVELEKKVNLKISQHSLYLEDAIIKSGPDTSLNKVITEVENAGGEVRSLLKHPHNLLPSSKVEDLSYFYIDKSGKPIIALEKGADAATIAHELDHFRMWKSFKEKFIKEGLSDQEAIAKANKVMTSGSPKLVRKAESSAVNVELQHRNLDLFSSDLTERTVYPERAAIANAYDQAKDINKIPSKILSQVYQQMDDAISKALTIREIRISEIQAQMRRSSITPAEYSQLNTKLTEQFNNATLGKEMGFGDSSSSMNLFKSRLSEVQKRRAAQVSD